MTMHDEDNKLAARQLRRSAFVGLRAGCLTFLVAGAAIIGGWLLDTRLVTFPRWTLIFLIGSAPLTLGGVYLLVRKALKRAKNENKENHQAG